MNIESYIASGILELYVLGHLSEEERMEVEANARQYPAIRQELEATGKALETYLRSQGAPLPEGLEDKILVRLRRQQAKASTTQKPGHTAADPPSQRRPIAVATALAAMVLAVLLFYIFPYRTARNELDTLRKQHEELRASFEENQQQSRERQEKIYAVLDTATRAVRMAGLPVAPDALTIVYWNPGRQFAFLDVKNLPPPPTGKQYQLWSIADGQPTSMGVFQLDAARNTLLEVPFVQRPQAFAITLEDEGGSPAPTFDQMYVVGNVK